MTADDRPDDSPRAPTRRRMLSVMAGLGSAVFRRALAADVEDEGSGGANDSAFLALPRAFRSRADDLKSRPGNRR